MTYDELLKIKIRLINLENDVKTIKESLGLDLWTIEKPNGNTKPMGTPTESERRLLAYMTGFRMGVMAAVLTEANKVDGDLMVGYEAGRDAKWRAYTFACEKYEANLSCFR